MTTLVFCLLSSVCLSLAVPVEEKTRSRKTRDMSLEDLNQARLPGQSGSTFGFLTPMDQFPGLELTPNRFPSIIRPYSPAYYPIPYPIPYPYPYLNPYPHSYSYVRPYPHLYPRPRPPLFPFRPSVAVQPPIIVIERVPSPTTVSPTGRPPATGIPAG